jgi:hypothetical protein
MDAKLQKANLHRGFYSIIDGERASHCGLIAATNPANGQPYAERRSGLKPRLDELFREFVE